MKDGDPRRGQSLGRPKSNTQEQKQQQQGHDLRKLRELARTTTGDHTRFACKGHEHVLCLGSWSPDSLTIDENGDDEDGEDPFGQFWSVQIYRELRFGSLFLLKNIHEHTKSLEALALAKTLEEHRPKSLQKCVLGSGSMAE